MEQDDKKTLGQCIFNLVGCLSFLYEHCEEFNDDQTGIFMTNPCAMCCTNFVDGKFIINCYNSNYKVNKLSIPLNNQTSKMIELFAIYFPPSNVKNYVKLSDAVRIRFESEKFYDQFDTINKLNLF